MKKKTKQQFHRLGEVKPLGAVPMIFVLSQCLTDVINYAKYDLDRSTVSSRWVLEENPVPLKASIARTTSPCVTVLACDVTIFVISAVL
jgi:hypothetical protein